MFLKAFSQEFSDQAIAPNGYSCEEYVPTGIRGWANVTGTFLQGLEARGLSSSL